MADLRGGISAMRKLVRLARHKWSALIGLLTW